MEGFITTVELFPAILAGFVFCAVFYPTRYLIFQRDGYRSFFMASLFGVLMSAGWLFTEHALHKGYSLPNTSSAFTRANRFVHRAMSCGADDTPSSKPNGAAVGQQRQGEIRYCTFSPTSLGTLLFAAALGYALNTAIVAVRTVWKITRKLWRRQQPFFTHLRRRSDSPARAGTGWTLRSVLPWSRRFLLDAATSFAAAYRWISWCFRSTRNDIANAITEHFGNAYARAIQETASQDERLLLMLSLKSGKVYIGRPLSVSERAKDPEHIVFLPQSSGYRDPTTRKLVVDRLVYRSFYIFGILVGKRSDEQLLSGLRLPHIPDQDERQTLLSRFPSNDRTTIEKAWDNLAACKQILAANDTIFADSALEYGQRHRRIVPITEIESMTMVDVASLLTIEAQYPNHRLRKKSIEQTIDLLPSIKLDGRAAAPGDIHLRPAGNSSPIHLDMDNARIVVPADTPPGNYILAYRMSAARFDHLEIETQAVVTVSG